MDAIKAFPEPLLAKTSVSAAPMPLEAPVIKTTLENVHLFIEIKAIAENTYHLINGFTG